MDAVQAVLPDPAAVQQQPDQQVAAQYQQHLGQWQAALSEYWKSTAAVVPQKTQADSPSDTPAQLPLASNPAAPGVAAAPAAAAAAAAAAATSRAPAVVRSKPAATPRKRKPAAAAPSAEEAEAAQADSAKDDEEPAAAAAAAASSGAAPAKRRKQQQQQQQQQQPLVASLPTLSVPSPASAGADSGAGGSAGASPGPGTSLQRGGSTSSGLPALNDDGGGSLGDKDLRELRRKQSNRESARRSRMRKAAESDTLQQRLTESEAQRAALLVESAGLKQRMEQLLLIVAKLSQDKAALLAQVRQLGGTVPAEVERGPTQLAMPAFTATPEALQQQLAAVAAAAAASKAGAAAAKPAAAVTTPTAIAVAALPEQVQQQLVQQVQQLAKAAQAAGQPMAAGAQPAAITLQAVLAQQQAAAAVQAAAQPAVQPASGGKDGSTPVPAPA